MWISGGGEELAITLGNTVSGNFMHYARLDKVNFQFFAEDGCQLV